MLFYRLFICLFILSLTISMTGLSRAQDDPCDYFFTNSHNLPGCLYQEHRRSALFGEIEDALLLRKNETLSLGEALIWAAEEGDIDNIIMLLDAGVPIDSVDESGNTAIIQAARYNHFEVVELLEERGADYYLVNNDGETAYSIFRGKSNFFPKKRL